LTRIWDGNTNAFSHFTSTLYYNSPERKVGTFNKEASIDWFTTLRKDPAVVLADVDDVCPTEKWMLFHQTEAQGFGSAPYDVDAYNHAHEFAFVLGAPYHDIFLCEVSKMTDVCDFNIGNDDDESLYGKAHHVTTCYPDLAGRTCNTDETMTSDYVYTAHYDITVYSWNQRAFHTHYPPAFLANTVAVIQTALLQDPVNFYEFVVPNTYTSESSPTSYNIGNSDSIVHYWFGMDSCDCGAYYDGLHYGWTNTHSYKGRVVDRVGICPHYFNYWVYKLILGNVYWPHYGSQWMENDPSQNYYTVFAGDYYFPTQDYGTYTCSRMDTYTSVQFPCSFNGYCNYHCNGTTIPDAC